MEYYLPPAAPAVLKGHLESKGFTVRTLDFNITVKETFDLAVQNHKKNNLQAAEKLYKQILEIEPDHIESIFYLGSLSMQIGNFDRAKQLLNKTIQIDPSHAQAYNNLGAIAFQKLKKNQEAISYYEKAIQINPNFTQALNNLGIALNAFGEYKKAIKFYQKAIQINPNFTNAHTNLGASFHEIGEYKKAISAYEKAIEINPNFSSAHLNLGVVFEDLGDYRKAISCYEKALKLNPDAVNAQANISNICIAQLDNLEKAISESNKTLKIHNKTFKFINQKIPLYRLKHDVQQAEYLSSKNYKINGIDKFQKVGSEILAREENEKDNSNFNKKILLNQNEIESLLPFYKANHVYQTSKISGSCINPDKNWKDVEEQYLNSPKQIIYIDNFLSEEAVKELREFCLVSKVWHREYEHKYLGSFSDRGFVSPVHLQIAIDLKEKLPKLFGQHNLGKFWAFKYDSTLGKGINIHADFALINLNFWITPDEYNNEKNAGGLKVYDTPAPEDWTYEQYNIRTDKIYKFLYDSSAKCTNIPYKFNRAVLFNSAYFHETDKINFKDVYEARRINITYLFGNRTVKKKH